MYLQYILDSLDEVRTEPKEEIAAATSRNAMVFFNFSPT
jgi:hypothetical protein